VGEVLHYVVSCPILPRVGELRVWVRSLSGCRGYFIRADFRLTGVIGAISLQRKEVFASLMQWSDKDGRYRPIWFAKQVSRSGSWRRKVKIFDHSAGNYIEYRISPKGLRKKRRRVRKMPVDDPLSAYMNWREGAFGPISYGRTYIIDNIARKEPTKVVLTILSEEEAMRKSYIHSPPKGWSHLVKVALPHEYAKVVRGDVLVWLDSSWAPLYGVATQVKLVGTIKASLLNRTSLPEPILDGPPSPPVQRGLWKG
jgi:hypothetical protein